MGQQAGLYYATCCDTRGNFDCDQLVFSMLQVVACTFGEDSWKNRL